jgi:GT2 family glycosyltransferase
VTVTSIKDVHGKMLNVSVVVPVRNAIRTLPSCLSALEKLDPPPRELVFVDNGSSDGSRELIEKFAQQHGAGAQVFKETKRGASAARNAGIWGASGEVVAFTDADCSPEKDWLEHLHVPFEDPGVGAVAGRVLGQNSGGVMEMFSTLYTFQMPHEMRRHSRWSPWSGGYPTANLAVRRRLLQDLNGFDESVLLYGEDYDLCARIYESGNSLLYTPVARVHHHHRTSLSGLLRQAFGFGRSHAYLFRRHGPKGIWVDLPSRSISWANAPVSAWIDIASPDKKVLSLLGLGLLYGPALALLLLYSGWLLAVVKRRAGREGWTMSPMTTCQVAMLLLLKAGAMTAGRCWGSLKYASVCI